MVCRREKMTGSHRPETICKTVAQRRVEREEARSRRSEPRNTMCKKTCGNVSGTVEGW